MFKGGTTGRDREHSPGGTEAAYRSASTAASFTDGRAEGRVCSDQTQIRGAGNPSSDLGQTSVGHAAFLQVGTNSANSRFKRACTPTIAERGAH